MLEIVICFGPMLILLGAGLIVIPVSIMSLAEGEFGGLPLLAIILGGGLGMTSLIALTLKILDPNLSTLSPRKIQLFMSCGVLSILGFAFVVGRGGISWQAIFFVLPLFASAHLLYLGRSYVLRKNG
ncbi:hypothetical protein [Neptuniibacter pectenicola]|uniref:hypothetical protein n=1 Tax=Neptuniibacter pectenicola TaxID=1806669 RepID=UPI0030EC9B66